MIRPTVLGALASLALSLIGGSALATTVHAQRDLAALLLPSNRAYTQGEIDTTVQPHIVTDGWPCANDLSPVPLPIARASAAYFAFDTGHDDYVITAEQYQTADDARAAVEFAKSLVEHCNNSTRASGAATVVVEMHGNSVDLANNVHTQIADDAYRFDATEQIGSTAVAITEDFILLNGGTVIRLHKNANTGRNSWTFGQYLLQLVHELDARLAE